MNANALYFVAGVLLAAAVGAGAWMVRDHQRDGVEISVGRDGLSIERR